MVFKWELSNWKHNQKKLGQQSDIVSNKAALNRNITFINKFLLFVFSLSSRNRSDEPCTCKNSYWLYFVGSVDYLCLTCHVSYHPPNPQGSASGLLTVVGNTDTAKGPIFSPGATGAPGTVPALISVHIGHGLFTLSKHSEIFNLSKDCPLVCPQGRGMKLVIIKKKTSYSSFSSALWGTCPAEVIPAEASTLSLFISNTKGSEQGATPEGPDLWMGQDMMGCPNMPFLFTLLSQKSRFKSSDLVLYHFRFCPKKSWKSHHALERVIFGWLSQNFRELTVYWYSHRGSQQLT